MSHSLIMKLFCVLKTETHLLTSPSLQAHFSYTLF